MSKFISIKPLDTLFFRGAKPFNMSDDSWSDSYSLPFPSVIWGTLYAHLYFKDEEAKQEENFKNLKIKNIYLYNFKDKSIFLTMPNDVFSDGKELYIGEYKKAPKNSSYPLEYINCANTNEPVERLKNSFLRVDSLSREYIKKSSSLIYEDSEDIFLQDHKVGIAIDKRRKATKEGHLYRVDLTQFEKEWGFLVEYDLEIFEFELDGYLKLGGESKVAKFQHIDKPNYIESYEKDIEKFKNNFDSEKYFKLYIKSPTAFKEGWKPTLIDCNLLCANIDEYLSIGGFDMQTKKQKAKQRVMKRFVPSGAVYVFEKQQQSYREIKELIEKEIEEHNETHKGFGLFEILEA